ncbi:MAG: IS91 family transposase [Clostridiales bacterium]|nr:IS91 family transposase [Clostridiales bacterium]
MSESKIQQVFSNGFRQYLDEFSPSKVQHKAASSIMSCKTGNCGHNISICDDCGHTDFHSNSCRNRNCPNCQAILKEVWVDSRRAEVIAAPYFHVVFTLPAELNPLIYANQALLYSLMHRCSAETLLELSSDKKYLGATPGIIQVLHTWGQKLNFHPHIHCIVSGAGLTGDLKLKTCRGNFFIPVKVMASKFRGKFLAALQPFYASEKLAFSSSCEGLRSLYAWNEFRDSLYRKDWCPYIKETFNGFGNAIEYLGRYTHRIAITNTRILSVGKTHVTFSAKDYKTGENKDITLENKEFIRRLLMHVLPPGFQKIRYYGFLNNRGKKKNLRIIFKIQGSQKFQSMLSGLPMDEVLKQVWGYDIHICPVCGCYGMHQVGRTFPLRN